MSAVWWYMRFTRFRSRTPGGWWLLVGAAVVTGGASVAAQSWAGVIGSAIVTSAGLVGTVVTGRASARLAERSDLTRRLGRDLYLTSRGGLPRVRDLRDPVHAGVYAAATLDVEDPVLAHSPPFVRRDRSEELEEALRRGGFVVVVGDSTAGKSRAAFEAMRACLPDHRFVRPRNRVALRTALEAIHGGPDCVVWLDDLQGYLGGEGLTAHTLTSLLQDDRRHLVVLATMRTQDRVRHSARETYADTGVAEIVREWREALDLATEIRLDRHWSPAELDRARTVVDGRISAAIAHADQFGVAEYLAAGPRLLREWADGWAPGAHPRGAALVAAAVDARRAGVFRGMPLDVLEVLHTAYLDARGGARLRPEPWDQAVAWAIEPRHATSSLLVPEEGTRHAAFDYLADAVDSDPAAAAVPDQAWRTLIAYVDPADAIAVGQAAVAPFRRWHHARAAFQKALDGGHRTAAVPLADCLGGALGDEQGAADLLRQVASTGPNRHGADVAADVELRRRLAWWVGMAGDPAEALRMTEAVTADSVIALGAEHPQTIACRRNIARWRGVSGDTDAALLLARQVEGESRRVLGPDHEATLSTRFEVAVWTGYTADARVAARLWEELIDHATSAPDQDVDHIGYARLHLASVLSDARASVDVLRTAVAAVQAQAGDGSPRLLLDLRDHLAWSTGMAGDVSEARTLAIAVAADMAALRGPAHRRTLSARSSVARWTGKAGDTEQALAIAAAAAVTARDLFGPHDRVTFHCRFEEVVWIGCTTPGDRAVAVWRELERDAATTPGLGRFAVDVRRNLAYQLGIAGQVEEARSLLERVIEEYGRALNPLALAARVALVHAVGQLGPPEQALRLADGVLADCGTHLSAVHPVTLNSRFEQALWLAECGDTATALDRLEAVREDAERAVPVYHRLIHDCRVHMQWLTGQPVDEEAARRDCWMRLAEW